MITMPCLQTALLDLLNEVQGTEVKLIIGGGYGIYLKNNHVRRMGMGTLLHEWPEPRSTSKNWFTRHQDLFAGVLRDATQHILSPLR